MPSNSSAVSQELRRLDVSSPDFQNQLNGTLSGEGFTERVVGLARNDLVWAVDYLDEVRHSIPLPYSRSPQRRFSIVSTLLAPFRESVYTNSEAYVALRRYSPHPTRVPLTC